MGRISLANSLWLVAFIALGFAAIREASDFWVGATFLATLGMLCGSVLGAVLERGRGGAWWLGFALFGWAYFVAVLIPGLQPAANIPSRHATQRIFDASNRTLIDAAMKGGGQPGTLARQELERRSTRAFLIGRWLFILAFARAGATASCVFTKGLPWGRRPAPGPVPASSPVP